MNAATPPALLQFEFRILASFMQLRNVGWRILRLQSCERVGRVAVASVPPCCSDLCPNFPAHAMLYKLLFHESLGAYYVW